MSQILSQRSPNPQPALDRSPNEVQTIIISFVHENDLLALRKTCRLLCENAYDAFGEAFFSERKHILSDHSLETLLEISTHPHFARHVRIVKLGSTLIGNFTPTPRQNKPVLLAYFNKIHEEQQIRLWTAGHGMTILEEIFRNIRRHNRCISIGIYDDLVENQTPGPGYGTRHFYGPLDGAFVAESIPTRMLQLLIDAALTVGCSISGIEIATDTCDRALATSTKWEDGPYREMLRNLRYLDFESHYLFRPTTAHVDKMVPMMRELTKKATNLESFRIDVGRRPSLFTLRQPVLTSRIHENISVANLKELHLAGQGVRSHFDSTHIELQKYTSTPGDIKSIFEYLIDELTLESLTFGMTETEITAVLKRGSGMELGTGFGLQGGLFGTTIRGSGNPMFGCIKPCPLPLSLCGDWGKTIKPKLYDVLGWMEDMRKAIGIQAEMKR